VETDLILADSDGKNEHQTITVISPKRIVQLAWSPDRRSIAVAIDEKERAFAQSLAIVSAESGSQLRIFHNINFYHFSWLPDGSGIVLCGSRPRLDDVDQLWILALPEGSLRKITSDLNNYRQLAVSADGRNLATSYKQLDSSIWIAPIDRPSDAKQIVINAGRMDGFGGLTWLPGNRLLFVGSEPQKQIWCMDFDGNHRQQLTYLKDDALDPSVTKDGSNILFTFENGVWRMGVDGSEPRQIVETKTSRSLAAISPDGAWFVYQDTAGLLRRSILGGDPTLIDPAGDLPAVSRDGRKIAFEHWGDDKDLQLGVVAADSTGPPRFLPFLPKTEEQVPTMGNQPIQWTPSGDAITYVRTIGGVSNLWSQPVTGGPPKQITRFTSGYIWRHAWSMDGKYLALARGTFSKDAVLFSDLR
jgi:Tol biopolymer transport system component